MRRWTRTTVLMMTVLLFSMGNAVAAGSKTNADMIRGIVVTGAGTEETVNLIKPEATEALKTVTEAVTRAAESGSAVEGLPEAARALVKEGFHTINEMTVWKMEGLVKNPEEVELVFTFETPYAEGEEVLVLIGISPADEEVEWLALDGLGDAEGNVVVKVTEKELKKISDNPFIVIPISKE